MDEAVPRGRAEVPQRAGESRQETGQAEERLCLGWRWPLTSSAQPSSAGVFGFQHPIVGGTWGVCGFFCFVFFKESLSYVLHILIRQSWTSLSDNRTRSFLAALVGAWMSDFRLPDPASLAERLQVMPPHEAAQLIKNWCSGMFFFTAAFLSANRHCGASQQVEQFRTRDKMFSALLLSFRSDAETQHEAIKSNLKKILLHALLYRGGWFPLHLTLFLLWAMGHTCLCYREFQRENGFMTCSWAHAFSVASQSRHRVSCLLLEAADFVRHRSSLFFFFTFGSVTLVY